MLAVLLSFPGQSIADDARAKPPVYYPNPKDNPTVSVEIIGTYRGGWFSKNTPAPPVYDATTKRLFLGSGDRKALEALDIGDFVSAGNAGNFLSKPTFSVDLTPWGGEPSSIAAHKGLVAVVVRDHDDPSDPSKPSYVVIFSAVDGQVAVNPIRIDRSVRVAFTPNGQKLAVTVSGGPFGDQAQQKVIYLKDGVSILDLGPVNWGSCRQELNKCHISVPGVIPLVDYTSFDKREGELIAAGIRIFAPTDDNVYVSDVLHSESITISPDSRAAYVALPRNNAIAEIDLEGQRVTNLFALGTKDHSLSGNGLDASDKDGGIYIKPWPIRSFYEAGHLAVVGRGAQSFLVTVNQGDPWDEDWFREKVRVNNPSYRLDTDVFPDAVDLKKDKNLGRLNVTNLNGYNDKGTFEEIYTLGSRSFSIRDMQGALLFDSGDAFEKVTAAALPSNFNCAEDDNTIDQRSDDRGPEPKEIAVGNIKGRDYAFIGLERISGVLIYDITNRKHPIFQLYFNNRNFSVQPKIVCANGGNPGQPALPDCYKAGDLSTEGLVFIRQNENPIRAPLLAVANEASDSTTLYRINPVRK